MNADEAVRTHREWKDRLRLAMAKREILDIEAVSSDKNCAFGEWLYSERSNCRFQDADLARCVALHAAFHLEAARLASLINAGRYLELMRVDKKAEGGEIRFVVIDGPSRAGLRTAPDELVRKVVDACCV